MLSTYQLTHGVCSSGLNTPHTHINYIKRCISPQGEFNNKKIMAL